MVLNMLSTAVMVKLGKVYSNLMVDVCASNQKLVARAVSIVCCATGVSPERARGVLDEAGFSAKTAIVMILCGVDAGEAHALLQRVDGQVSAAVYRGRTAYRPMRLCAGCNSKKRRDSPRLSRRKLSAAEGGVLNTGGGAAEHRPHGGDGSFPCFFPGWPPRGRNPDAPRL